MSKAAERQARRRLRRQLGWRVLPVAIDEQLVLEALLASGRLTEVEALDEEKVAAAVAELVEQWSEKWAEHAAR